MPYIEEAKKAEIKTGTFPRDCGELNYALTTLITSAPEGTTLPPIFRMTLDTYVTNAGKAEGKMRYKHINDAMGVVACMMFEFRRRKKSQYMVSLRELFETAWDWYDTVAGPYEDTKIKENGDVF